MLGQAFAVGDNEAGHTLLGHLQGKVVSIEVLAFQGEEYSVFFNLAAVGGDFVCFLEMLINGLYHMDFYLTTRRGTIERLEVSCPVVSCQS